MIRATDPEPVYTGQRTVNLEGVLSKEVRMCECGSIATHLAFTYSPVGGRHGSRVDEYLCVMCANRRAGAGVNRPRAIVALRAWSDFVRDHDAWLGAVQRAANLAGQQRFEVDL